MEEQFNEYGLTSLLVRLDDKMRRLKNLQNNEAQVDESRKDTVLDLAGYSVLGYILLSSEENDEIPPGPLQERKGLVYPRIADVPQKFKTYLDTEKGEYVQISYHDQDDQY